MEIIFVAVIVLLIIIFLVIEALVLNGVLRLFKVENTSFKKAVLIIILGQFFSGVIGFFFAVFISLLAFPQIPYVIEILGLVIGILIFHLLLNKFYKTGFAKNLGIYVVYTIAVVILALATVIPIRIFIAEPFIIKAASMEPNLEDNDYTIFQKFDKSYDRGDIIVFRYPKDPRQFFIKRIVGLPGETLEIKEGNLYLYNDQYPAGVLLDESDYLPENTLTPSLTGDGNPLKTKLAADEYYMLGDNRQASLDSRKFGAVNKTLFIGKYWLTLSQGNNN